jgi:hypothetical protein
MIHYLENRRPEGVMIRNETKMVAVLMGWVACLVCGCGSDGFDMESVRGRVTLNGEPITTGTVSFRPDPAKGNTSLHHPTGPIDPEGNYQLFTAGKPGAPTGWYKVLVFADANAKPSKTAHPLPPRWLVPEKYTREAGTPLFIEVRPGTDSERYDLKLVK